MAWKPALGNQGNVMAMPTRLRSALAAALLLAAACSQAPPEESAPGWGTSDLVAASGPVGLGDTVAVVDGTTTDLKMVVLDAAGGEVRFTRPWTPSARYPGTGVGRPALLEGVVVGAEPNGFQALLVGRNPQTGRELWKVEVAETFGPFVCGELVCSEDNWSLESAALVARDPATGETRWTVPGSQFHLYAEDDLLVEQDLNEPVVRSIDPASGQERWRTDLRASLGPETTSVVAQAQLVDGTLIVEATPDPNGPNGTVGLDPANGAVKWIQPDMGLCPQPTPEVVVTCSATPGLRRVDPGTGAQIWFSDQFQPPREAGPLSGVTGDLTHVLGRSPENRPVAISLDDGTASEPEPGLSFMRLFSDEHAKKGPNFPAGQYLGPLDPVPWDAGTGGPASVNDAEELPDFIGLDLAGMRIFLEASGGLRALPAG